MAESLPTLPSLLPGANPFAPQPLTGDPSSTLLPGLVLPGAQAPRSTTPAPLQVSIAPAAGSASNGTLPEGTPPLLGPPAAPQVIGGAPNPTSSFDPPPIESYQPNQYADLPNIFVNAEPNALNAYYNATYHFRLFVMADAELNDIDTGIQSKISSDRVRKITIAESGVTGSSIKEVEIKTVYAQTNGSKEQYMTGLAMTVIDPLGMSFLDGLVDAGIVIGSQDYTKMPYFLELSFKAYDEQGVPVKPANLPNGGYWIWSTLITDVDVKMNEGGGVFILQMLAMGSGGSPLSRGNNDESRVPGQAITVVGTTVKEMFADFTAKLNNAWKNNYGDAAGKTLVTTAIVTHPIAIGPDAAMKKDPGDFKLKAQEPYKSSQRTWSFEGDDKVSCHVPPDATVAEFITNVISSTEEAQKLMKDVKTINDTDNKKGYREVVVFSVETDMKNTGFDKATGNYIKQVTFHVVSHYSIGKVILDKEQVTKARTPAVQNEMLQKLIDHGLLKKRYDYMFTGLNTEVLNFDIQWNFAWNSILPKLVAGRAGYVNVSVNAVQNSNNPAPQQGAEKQVLSPDTTPVKPQASSDSASSAPSGSIQDEGTVLQGKQQTLLDQIHAEQANTTQILQSGAPITDAQNAHAVAAAASFRQQTADLNAQQTALLARIPPSMTDASANSNPVSTATSAVLGSTPGSAGQFLVDQHNQALAAAAPGTAAVTKLSGGSSSTALPQVNSGGGNSYIEDLEDALAQPIKSGSMPISFKHGYMNVTQEGAKGFQQQYHGDSSIVAAVFSQLYAGDDMTNGGKFQTMEMEIRGDPYWLGQTHFDRMEVLRPGAATYSKQAAPDFVSAKEVVFIHFRYPLTVGDDFVPVLKGSEAFNGLYEVFEVKHTFVDGAFKQHLTLLRLPLFDASSTGATPGGTGLNSGDGKPGAGSATGTSGGNTAKLTTAVQQDNATQFKAALISEAASKGITLTSDQADGIVANAYRESGMDPNVAVHTDSNGKPVAGLLQWNGPRLTAANNFLQANYNTDITTSTVQQQAAFTIQELTTTQRGSLTALQGTNDAGSAADVFVTKFEVPLNPGPDQAKNRQFLPNLYGKTQ